MLRNLRALRKFSPNIQFLQSLLIVIIFAALTGAYLFGQHQGELMKKQMSLIARMQEGSSFALEVKGIQVDVLQVQQNLQDISSTRGLDGLDGGFRAAESFAQSFRSHLAVAISHLKTMGLDKLEPTLQAAGLDFEEYFETGVAMAHAYVNEGPAGGNKMMTAFDTQAGKLDDVMAGLVNAAESYQFTAKSEAGALAFQTKQLQRQLIMASIVAAIIASLVGAGVLLYTRRLQKLNVRNQEAALLAQAEQARLAQAQAERSKRVTDDLGAALEMLAHGNLGFNIAHPFPEDYEELRRSYNAAAHGLADVLTMVKDGAGHIHMGSGEIAKASRDLASRTETQAANLVEASAAVAEVLTTVKAAAAEMDRANDSVKQARDGAEQGAKAVQSAVKAMEEISGQTAQIHDILSMIDEIAFQTNLLALNAGVEAARAGDAGRGFAIVAMEVRNLAQKTSNAASEIKKLLETSGTSIRLGVDLVCTAGQCMDDILLQVQRVNSVVSEVNKLADAQTARLDEVNTTVRHMDGFTQQNAAMAEETRTATGALERQSTELAEVVARFHFNEAA